MHRNERGQSLVETALVSVFILVPLLIGLVALGPAFYGYIAIANGAREGARYGARNPLAITTIKAIAVSEAINGGVLLSNCGATVITKSDSDGRAVQVTVQCDYSPIISFGSGSITLQSVTTMKVEGP